MRLTFNGKRLRRFLTLTALLWLCGCASAPGIPQNHTPSTTPKSVELYWGAWFVASTATTKSL